MSDQRDGKAATQPIPWDRLSPESAEMVVDLIHTLSERDLSQSGRPVVLYLVRQLSAGFSGRVVANCGEGGVSSVTVEETRERHANGRRTIEVHTYRPGELPEEP